MRSRAWSEARLRLNAGFVEILEKTKGGALSANMQRGTWFRVSTPFKP